MSLRLHIDFTSSSLRFHFDLTLNSIRLHFDFTSESLQFHIDVISSSLRIHFDFTLISIRLHFDFTSDSLRCHFDFTSNSLRLSFDLTSISHGEKGKRPATQGKRENSAWQKAKGKAPPRIWARIPPGNQTARTHERNETISRSESPPTLRSKTEFKP